MNVDAYKNYSALIFDMDGTLVDSGQLHEKAWSKALEKYNLPIDRPLMRSLAGVPTIQTVDRIIENFRSTIETTSHEIALYKQLLVKELSSQLLKATKLKSVVEYFHTKKPLALGTGASTAEANESLTVCNLLDYFGAVVGADQINNPKPAPDTFLRCAELLGVRPENCIVFEDSPYGIQAAKDAGMDVVDVASELNIINDYFL